MNRVFRNVLIADSGKSTVEEMVRMLRDIPAVRQARLNLLHVVPEQVGESFTEHSQKAAGIAAEAVQRLGLNPSDVNTIIRQGDTKQTVLTVADELDSDLIVMGSRGMSRKATRSLALPNMLVLWERFQKASLSLASTSS